MRSPKSRQTEEMSVSHHATSLFDWYAEFRDSHRTRSHKRIENGLNGLACEIKTVGSLEHDDYIIGCLFPTPWKKNQNAINFSVPNIQLHVLCLILKAILD